MKRLPITLISGFKGVGKSSLIESVRAGLSGSRLGIIRDDGERDILADIHDLVDERCDYLLIENPPDGEPFVMCELLQDGDDHGVPPSEYCRVDCAVTVVDASTFIADVMGGDTLESRGLARDIEGEFADERTVPEVLIEQVEFADLIVLNKIDLISDGARERLISLLQRLNPHADLLPTLFGRVTARDVIDTGSFDMSTTDEESVGWLAELLGEYEGFGVENGVSSFTYRERRPFHPARLARLIAEGFRGRGVVRAKGSLWVATRHHEIGVWSMAGEASVLTYGGAWFASTPVREWPTNEEERAEIMREWAPPFGDRRQEIAFVGIDLQEREIRSRLRECLMTDEEMKDGPDSWRALPDPLPDWHFDTDEEPYGGDDYL